MTDTLQLIQRKLLIHAEVRIVDDVVKDVPRGLGVRVEQRLSGDAVCQHKDDAQQYEEHEVGNLQYSE